LIDLDGHASVSIPQPTGAAKASAAGAAGRDGERLEEFLEGAPHAQPGLPDAGHGYCERQATGHCAG
jgi:hypothetical protein